MQSILVVACVSVMSMCLTRPSCAQSGSSSASGAARTAVAERLTRDDVDRMLSQARAAIKAGKLEQAELLVRRAEGAGISYPFMHFGPKPSTVRRELDKARKARGATAPADIPNQHVNRSLPSVRTAAASGRSPAAVADPFLRPGTLPSSASARVVQGLPADPSDHANGEGAYRAAEPSPNLSRLGQPVGNPFAPAPTYNRSPYEEPLGAANEIMLPAGYGDDPSLSAAGGSGASIAGPARRGVPPLVDDTALPRGETWTLPDAPLPPKLNAARGAADTAAFAPGPRYEVSAASGTTRVDGPQIGKLLPSAQSMDRPATGVASGEPRPAADAKEQALLKLSAARQALDAGLTDLAEKYTREASALGVPESQFLPHEDRPSLVAWDILRARQSDQGAKPPGQVVTATPTDQGGRYAQLPQTLEPPSESTGAIPERLPQGTLLVLPEATPHEPATIAEAVRLLEAGEQSLRQHDRQSALKLFGQAYLLRDQLAPADTQRLQEHLQMLSAPPTQTATTSPPPRALPVGTDGRTGEPRPIRDWPGVVGQASNSPSKAGSIGQDAGGGGLLLDTADANQQVLVRQLQAEVGRGQTESRRLRETDPLQAMELLQSTRQKVVESQLSDVFRQQLLRRLDLTLDETRQYIEDHRAEIELDQRNAAVLAAIDRSREAKDKLRQRIAEDVDTFNQLRDEHRFAEMEVVARRLYELAPEEPVVQQILQNAKFIRREMLNRQLADLKEDSVYNQLQSVEDSLVNPVAKDGEELVFANNWGDLIKNRKGASDRNTHRSERDLEIERRLQTPVRLRYDATPLGSVIADLSQLAGVNIHLDPRGLSQEGVRSDEPITVNLNTDISLKSALSVILTPLHLSYVIKDEVLQITSEQLRDGAVYAKAYPVADLVIPIPNFVPSSSIGMTGLLNDAYAAMGRGQGGLAATSPSVLVNDRSGRRGAAGPNNDVLAQQFQPTSGGLTPATVPIGSGPGGMGGGANADFDSLIDLIVSTVATDSWAETAGGSAEVRPFPTNLSLVISQTQAVHEEIADLLEQLRRLQDLQVTIEVRFIRLNDTFFERIGIDFDANIEDRTIGTADLLPGGVFEGGRQSATVGITSPIGLGDFPRFTSDLDIPFRQNSFELSRVAFGSPADVATFGFAILSDIEAYFVIEAAQGDRRTNVLNAPKVTLFNGQQAFVSDVTQMPFVIGVIPVVGEFVAAQQPVIVVLNEGTMLSVQAVVSDDRRYVRLTVVPYFTQIGNVDTFTFEGSSSSTSSSGSTDDDGDGNNDSEEGSNQEARSGVTVQLPEFSFITVVTTVSVPDGGTVLLGGIKRLSEGRNEFGVPLLSKLPYVNRLFKNVGIGRTTDSLMMMVTPRIIIQEEEEERHLRGLGGIPGQ